MIAATSETTTRCVLQAAALCLQYPDEQRLASWPLVRDALSELADHEATRALRAFFTGADVMGARQLAQHYVDVFDRQRRCCLYLTWWTHGETRRRGAALAELKQRYRAAGVELADTELPDFLPIVAEYGATVDLADGLVLMQEHRPGLELLRLALQKAATPYAAPVRAICALLPGASPSDVAEAKALARSGPPSEHVGLEQSPFTPGATR